MIDGMLDFFVTLALLLWGVWFTPPEIQTQYHQPTQNIDAQGMAWAQPPYAGSPHCIVSVHPVHFPALPYGQQVGVFLHEVGHCLGLGHYGDCEIEPAVMASCPIPEPTARDRIELIRARGYRSVVPMMGH